MQNHLQVDEKYHTTTSAQFAVTNQTICSRSRLCHNETIDAWRTKIDISLLHPATPGPGPDTPTVILVHGFLYWIMVIYSEIEFQTGLNILFSHAVRHGVTRELVQIQ